MLKKINKKQKNDKREIVESTGIFFHKENLTPAGQIIQDAIKRRINH